MRTLTALTAGAIVGFMTASAAGAADMPPELADALAGKLKGTTVTAFGAFAGADEVKFNENVKAFEEKTGIDIQYEGTKQFEATISTRVDAGNVPDIVDFPQPGLMGNFASTGKLVDLVDLHEPGLPQEAVHPELARHGDQAGHGRQTDHGRRLGALQWQEPGLVPEEGLRRRRLQGPDDLGRVDGAAGSDRRRRRHAWCIGIESGAATGWPATDWMEEIMLRTTSLENYDKWATGRAEIRLARGEERGRHRWPRSG